MLLYFVCVCVCVYSTDINNGFETNFLSLDFEKISFIQFLTKNILHIPISVGCDNNIESNTTNINFFRINDQ